MVERLIRTVCEFPEIQHPVQTPNHTSTIHIKKKPFDYEAYLPMVEAQIQIVNKMWQANRFSSETLPVGFAAAERTEQKGMGTGLVEFQGGSHERRGLSLCQQIETSWTWK